jgi:hypothetical protein
LRGVQPGDCVVVQAGQIQAGQTLQRRPDERSDDWSYDKDSISWLRRRMSSMCDDVPVSQEALVALYCVLAALKQHAPDRDRELPEPCILYSGGGDCVELSWRNVGLFICSENIVMFRPKLANDAKWDFELPKDATALAEATWSRI